MQQQFWMSSRRHRNREGSWRIMLRLARIQDMRHHCHGKSLIETSTQAQSRSPHRRRQVIPVFRILHHLTTGQQEAQANLAAHIHLHPRIPSQRPSHIPTVPTARPAPTRPIPLPLLLHPTLPQPPSHRRRTLSHQASHPAPPTLLPPKQLHTPPLFSIGHAVRL